MPPIRRSNLGRKTRNATNQAKFRSNIAQRREVCLNRAFNCDLSIDYSNFQCVVIGSMNSGCSHCKALKYKNEANGLCCANGKVKLIPLDPPPKPVSSLVSGIGRDSIHFLTNFEQFNNCFQMTSFGATNVVRENCMPTFKFHKFLAQSERWVCVDRQKLQCRAYLKTHNGKVIMESDHSHGTEFTEKDIREIEIRAAAKKRATEHYFNSLKKIPSVDTSPAMLEAPTHITLSKPQITAESHDQPNLPTVISIKNEPLDDEFIENPFACFICGVDTNSQQELIDHWSTHKNMEQDPLQIDDTNSTEQKTPLNETGNPVGNIKLEDSDCIDDNSLTGDDVSMDIADDYEELKIEDNVSCDTTDNCTFVSYCNVCGFASDVKENVVKHMESHMSVVPLSCPPCRYIFSDKYYLRDYAHKRPGEKVFRCIHCKFDTDKHDSLKAHCITHHNAGAVNQSEVNLLSDSIEFNAPSSSSSSIDQMASNDSCSPSSSTPHFSIESTELVQKVHKQTEPLNEDYTTINTESGSKSKGTTRYFVVLKNCRSNGKPIGNVTIPAEQVLAKGGHTENSHNGSVDFLKELLSSSPCLPPDISESVCSDEMTKQEHNITFETQPETSSSTGSPLNSLISTSLPVINVRLPPPLEQELKVRRRQVRSRSSSGHIKERPQHKIQCSHCSYVARDKWNLKTHQLTHTGERPFACTQCSYRASQAAHLRKHLDTHFRKKLRTSELTQQV